MVDGITNSNRHEFEHASGDGEGQGRLEWGCKDLDTTERPNNNFIFKKDTQLQSLECKWE